VSFYDKPNFPSSKTLLAIYNAKKLLHFKQNQGDSQKLLEIWPPSRVPGTLKNHKIEYRKEFYNPSLTLIYKQEKFDSFQWRASTDQMREATRWGIVKTQSVTGQVIAALGQYRLIALERINNGLVSNRYLLKDKLLSHYQERFEALQKIESLANRDCDAAMLEKIFIKYKKELQLLRKKIADADNKDFDDVDPSGVQHIQREIDADIKYAEDFFENQKNKPLQQATGVNSFLTFTKTQMIRSLRHLQNHNQNITYTRKMSFAMTRGDLNSCIEDAEKIIEDYIAWPHDAVTADHHGRYKNENGIIYNSSYHCASYHDEQRALLAISFIEKQNIMDFSYPKNPKILARRKLGGLQHTKETNLQQIKATKWSVAGGWTIALEKALAWIANIAIKLVVGVIELPLTILIEPLTFGYVKGFFEWVREIATYEIPVENPNAPSLVDKELLEKTQRKPQTLGLRIKHFVVVAFKNTFEDLFYGIRDIYKQFSVHLFDSISDDYRDGKNKLPKLNDVIEASNDERKKIIDDARVIANDFQETLNVSSKEFAEPLFVTDTGEFNDILNAGAADGVQAFAALYLHNIYAKHPFTSVLFSFTYVVGGLAVLAPHSVAFLSSQYIAYSQAMGHSMSKSPFTAAISSAITQAQMTSSLLELFLHGHESWMAKGAKEFERDPFTSLCYVGTALGLGYTLLHMPGIGPVLKEDMGTFPPSSLVFVGAKLGLLVYELLMEHQELDLDKTVSASKLRKYLTQIYCEAHGSNDRVKMEEEVSGMMCAILGADNIQALRKACEELKAHTIKSIENLPNHKCESFNQLLTQGKILDYLMQNQSHLPHFSAQTKHQWLQQLKAHFPADQARSLNKMFYPETMTSILRTTLKVIFSYPAYMVRVLAALISSIRWGNLKPLQSAGTDFGLKILKDLTRVGRAFNKFCKLGFLITRRLGKTLADVLVNSFLARTQALLMNSHSIANTGYAFSAAVDVNFEKARQLLSTPVDAAVRVVTTSHPVDVNRKHILSYVKMMRELPAENDSLPVELIPSLPSSEIETNSRGENIIKGNFAPKEVNSTRVTSPGR
jgi:hypothetical protein